MLSAPVEDAFNEQINLLHPAYTALPGAAFFGDANLRGLAAWMAGPGLLMRDREPGQRKGAAGSLVEGVT